MGEVFESGQKVEVKTETDRSIFEIDVPNGDIGEVEDDKEGEEVVVVVVQVGLVGWGK